MIFLMASCDAFVWISLIRFRAFRLRFGSTVRSAHPQVRVCSIYPPMQLSVPLSAPSNHPTYLTTSLPPSLSDCRAECSCASSEFLLFCIIPGQRVTVTLSRAACSMEHAWDQAAGLRRGERGSERAGNGIFRQRNQEKQCILSLCLSFSFSCQISKNAKRSTFTHTNTNTNAYSHKQRVTSLIEFSGNFNFDVLHFFQL